MSAERGDRKPCTHLECRGTMQFGREPLTPTTSAGSVEGERGWVCSADPHHFTLRSSRPDAAENRASALRDQDRAGS